jgi:alpha-L-arabinofuranosidase
MTTLTVLADEESKSPSISLDQTHTIDEINPLIYGGFTEYVSLGRRWTRQPRQY